MATVKLVPVGVATTAMRTRTPRKRSRPTKRHDDVSFFDAVLYASAKPPRRRVQAYWTDNPATGSCSGCTVPGRVLVMNFNNTQVRACADCLREMQLQLEGEIPL